LLTLKGSCDRRNSAGTASGDMIPDAASVSVETAVSPELNLSFPEFPQFLRRAPDNSGQPVEHAL